MIITGIRCNSMLSNHCQCPNAATSDSCYCILHDSEIPLNKAQMPAAQALELNHKEHKAPLSNNE